MTHPSVQDDAVAIQITEEGSGELPRAYVVLKDGMTDVEGDIQAWVKERVAPYKRLYGGVVFTDTADPKISWW